MTVVLYNLVMGLLSYKREFFWGEAFGSDLRETEEKCDNTRNGIS